jgi:hypothetical protein
MLCKNQQAKYLNLMDTPQVNPSLVKRYETLLDSDKESAMVLRGLYRLYFGTKRQGKPADRNFILLRSFEFSSQNVPPLEDSQIFDEEYRRYHNYKPKKSAA